MTDEEFREWLFTPLSVADLMELELAAAAREHALIEARVRADELLAETERQAAWDRTAADVALRDLALAAGPTWPERRSSVSMLRSLARS